MTGAELAAQTVVAVVIVVCFTVLVALGHDADVLLAVLAGQGLSIGAHKVAQRAAP